MRYLTLVSVIPAVDDGQLSPYVDREAEHHTATWYQQQDVFTVRQLCNTAVGRHSCACASEYRSCVVEESVHLNRYIYIFGGCNTPCCWSCLRVQCSAYLSHYTLPLHTGGEPTVTYCR